VSTPVASIMSTNPPDERRPRRRGVGAERGGEEQQVRDEVEHLLEMVQRGAARHGLHEGREVGQEDHQRVRHQRRRGVEEARAAGEALIDPISSRVGSDRRTRC
jgi:hypothetical protein